MSGGKFYGTKPCAYFNTLFYFFQKLHSEGKKICEDFGLSTTSGVGAYYASWGEGTTADGVRKDSLSGDMHNVINHLNENIFSYEIGYLPLRKDFFDCETPVFNSCTTEAWRIDWIQEEIVKAYDGGLGKHWGVLWSHLMEWGEQKYKYVQLMRYIQVPVKVSFSSLKYLTSDYFTMGDYLYTVELPSYWKKGGADSKIAVIIFKEDDTYLSKWIDSSIKITKKDGYGFYVYGAVDLSTHPDFVGYFDDDFVFPSID